MATKLQSFVLGMAIAAVILFAGMLASDAMRDASPDQVDGELGVAPAAAAVTQPETSVTAVLASDRGEPAPVAATAEPPAQSMSVPPLSPETAAPEPTVEPVPATATSAPPARLPSSSSQAGPPPPTPAPPSPTAHPFFTSMTEVIAGLNNDLAALLGRLAVPEAGNAAWEAPAIALAKRIELTAGFVSIMSPPACLSSAHAMLRASTSEMSRGSGMVVTGVELRDASFFRSATQLLTSGQRALTVVQSQLSAALC
jgi:hypothetical protein